MQRKNDLIHLIQWRKLKGEGWVELTVILAGYAAVLSTILGIREIRKEKREVKLYFEVIEKSRAAYESNVVLVNSGHRTITISVIGLRFYETEPRIWKYFPKIKRVRIPRLAELITNTPVTLNDGEQRTIKIHGRAIIDDWFESNYVEVYAYDAEGKYYKSRKVRVYDEFIGKFR